MQIFRFLSIFIIIFLFSSTLCVGQVTIAPTSIFINDQEQFGSFTAINNSDNTQEVSISFLFGYPSTDSTGRVSMVYKDTTNQTDPNSIIPYVRGFPQNFVLQPEQRQSVRIAVRPQKDLDDGTYWGRVKITSNPQTPPIEASKEDQITAEINFRFEQIIAILYRKGNTTTGINFNDLYTQNSDSLYHVFSNVKRTGNSPFHGTVSLSISKNGKIILEKQSSIAVYFDYLKRFDIPYSELNDGETYNATVTFRSQRSDISSENLIKIDPVSESTTFTVSK